MLNIWRKLEAKNQTNQRWKSPKTNEPTFDPSHKHSPVLFSLQQLLVAGNLQFQRHLGIDEIAQLLHQSLDLQLELTEFACILCALSLQLKLHLTQLNSVVVTLGLDGGQLQGRQCVSDVTGLFPLNYMFSGDRFRMNNFNALVLQVYFLYFKFVILPCGTSFKYDDHSCGSVCVCVCGWVCMRMCVCMCMCVVL